MISDKEREKTGLENISVCAKTAPRSPEKRQGTGKASSTQTAPMHAPHVMTPKDQCELGTPHTLIRYKVQFTDKEYTNLCPFFVNTTNSRPSIIFLNWISERKPFSLETWKFAKKLGKIFITDKMKEYSFCALHTNHDQSSID